MNNKLLIPDKVVDLWSLKLHGLHYLHDHPTWPSSSSSSSSSLPGVPQGHQWPGGSCHRRRIWHWSPHVPEVEDGDDHDDDDDDDDDDKDDDVNDCDGFCKGLLASVQLS